MANGKTRTSSKKLSVALVRFIFFGNYFYGVCAVGLAIEANLQQFYPLNDWRFYVMVFSLTVLYYTKAYLPHTPPKTNNPRSQWYFRNKKLMINSQLFFTIILAICLAWFAIENWRAILHMGFFDWFLLFAFPVFGALYYGVENSKLGKYNLRKIGWMKPFVIGFVWSGLVTIYPVLYYNVQHALHYIPTFIGNLLLLKNFMFVTVLSIMFDIKDYASDVNHQVHTFVVRVGLRKTIFYILIPLSLLGFGSFITYGTTHHFSNMKILLNTIPFISLIMVAYSLHRRKHIFTNRTAKDVILQEELANILGKDAIFILSDEVANGYDNRFIDEHFLRSEISDFSKHFYICGPDQMILDINATLAKLGAKPEAVIFEK